MTNRSAILAALLTSIICSISFGQQTERPRSGGDSLDRALAREEQAVFDDDGGRVFIVQRRKGLLDNVTYHGGPIISEPRQYSIFVGGAWAASAYATRKASLIDLMGGLDQQSRDMLDRCKVNTGSWSATAREELQAFPDGSVVSDLSVQGALSQMFGRGSVSGPDPNTIYVVFLAPGMQSTL